MIMETLFCPHEGSCKLYQEMYKNQGDNLNPDIISNIDEEYYSCRIFDIHKPKGAKKPKYDNIFGRECSHIRLLNLLNDLTRTRR